MLAWSDGVGSDALDCFLGVREGSGAVVDSRSFLEGLQRLVNSENLGIENLLVSAQVKAAARLAVIFPLPRAGGPRLPGLVCAESCI